MNQQNKSPIGSPIDIQASAADVLLAVPPGADGLRIESLSGIQGAVCASPGGPVMAVVPAGGTADVDASTSLWLRTSFGAGTFLVQGLVENRDSVPIQSSLKPIAHNTGNNTNNQYSHITGQTSVLTRALWCFPNGAAVVQPMWLGFEMPNSEGEVPIPNSLSIQAALELPDGHLVNLTFNGSPSMTLMPDALMKSDPQAVDIAPGAWCWLRTWIQVDAGGQIPYTHCLVGKTETGLHEGVLMGATSLGQTVPDLFGYSFDAACILGLPTSTSRRSIAVAGDSIAAYGADISFRLGKYAGMAAACQGWANRFCFQRYGLLNLSRSGYSIRHWSDDSGLLRKGVLANADTVIFEFGVNDLINGRTLGQIQADMQDAWMNAKAMGLTVLQTTLLPCSISGSGGTQSFFTGTGSTQTLASWESTRQALNAWIRTKPQFLDEIVDLESVIDPNRTGFWPVTAPIHVGTCGAGTASPGSATIVDAGSPGWAAGALANPADGWGPFVVVMTSGAAAGKSGAIQDNDGSSLTIGGTTNSSYPIFPGIAVGDTYAVTDAWSFEGTHPFPRVQAKLAAYLDEVLQPLLGK